MKILVIDLYNHKRDLAQMDMYAAMNEVFEMDYATVDNLMSKVKANDYDILWLGIHHQGMKINWDMIFQSNTRPVIIDQADNEEMMNCPVNYRQIKEKKLLSRYLPHDDLRYYWGSDVFLLPWYIDPKRFNKKMKVNDISFVCLINGIRIGLDRKKISNSLKSILESDGNFSYVIGQNFGEPYKEILATTRLVLIECGRLCLTQKYIEAALSGCIITGHVPLYPQNDLYVIPFDFDNITIDVFHSILKMDHSEMVRKNREYMLDTFANKNKFKKDVKSILV